VSELAAIYNSDVTGMCLEPPAIVSQPPSQAIPLGEDVKFTVGVQGSRPLHYQWFFNTRPIQGATNAFFVLEKVATNRVGAYSVSVSNTLGQAQSADANLTLLPSLVCTPAPPGLISWWPADNSPIDVVSSNNAVLQLGATYTTGKVGRAFTLTPFSPFQPGSIMVPNSPQLNFGSNADFTIEGWVKA